jgi:hypothetical protein
MLTRLGQAGTDAITMMRIANHSSITGFAALRSSDSRGSAAGLERLADLNAARYEEVDLKSAETIAVGTKVAIIGRRQSVKSPQVVSIKRAGP